jgi:hypothetical protein
MKAGEELLTSYVMSTRNYIGRQTSTNQTWLFKCTCPLCLADSHPLDNHQLRNKMMLEEWPAIDALTQIAEDIGITTQSVSENMSWKYTTQGIEGLTKLKDFVKRLDMTYREGRIEPKLELVHVLTEKQHMLADLALSSSETLLEVSPIKLLSGTLSITAIIFSSRSSMLTGEIRANHGMSRLWSGYS